MVPPDLETLPPEARARLGPGLELALFLGAEEGRSALEVLVRFAGPPTKADLDALRALAGAVNQVGPDLVAAAVPFDQLVAVLFLPGVTRVDAAGHASIS